jgi:hypothetical protein
MYFGQLIILGSFAGVHSLTSALQAAEGLRRVYAVLLGLSCAYLLFAATAGWYSGATFQRFVLTAGPALLALLNIRTMVHMVLQDEPRKILGGHSPVSSVAEAFVACFISFLSIRFVMQSHGPTNGST